MEFYKALEFIKTNDCAAYAVLKNTKEIFTMEYDDDAGRFADIIISWAQETSVSCSTVGNYTVDEALAEHPSIVKMDLRGHRVEHSLEYYTTPCIEKQEGPPSHLQKNSVS